MFITRFTNPIVFRITDNLFYETELIIRKWIDLDTSRNDFYKNKMYEKMFPLKFPDLYIFNSKWANPLHLFGSNRTKRQYYWMTISSIEDLNNFDALLRIHTNSNIEKNCVQDQELVKKQLMNGHEHITLFTI